MYPTRLFIDDSRKINIFNDQQANNPINNKNALEFLSKLIKQFKLTVNGNDYYVNKDVIYSVSSKIMVAQKEYKQSHNEDLLTYEISIKDPENATQKFIDICNGQVREVSTKKEIIFFSELSQILEFNIPSLHSKGHLYNYPSMKSSAFSLQSSNILYFFKNNKDLFEIRTSNGSYHFSYLLAHMSNVLYDLLLKDPKIRMFDYQFDDSNAEFQVMESFFSNININISPQNIENITMFAQTFDIPILKEKIENFSKNFEISQEILDRDFNEDSKLNELQDLLFELNDENLSNTISLIENSVWSSTFEGTKELVSNIAVVASYRHDQLHNLVKMCKSFSITIKNFLDFFTNFVLKVSNESILLCQFVYFLHKSDVIPIETILKFVSSQYYEINGTKTYYSMLVIFFYPEVFNQCNYIIESYSYPLKAYFPQGVFLPMSGNFISYEESREKMQNLDPMAVSIAIDDLTTLQKQIVQNSFDMKRTILQCPFDNIEEVSLINYAAYRGSINCFKYFVLNGVDVNPSTLVYAVIGDNAEIIRIVEQKLASEPNRWKDKNDFNNNNNFNPFAFNPMNYSRKKPITSFPGRAFRGKAALSSKKNKSFDHNDFVFAHNYYYYRTPKATRNSGLGTPIICKTINTKLDDYLLYASVCYHRNGTFEWIIQQSQNQSDLMEFLLYCLNAATENNNINALALIIDNGVTLSSADNLLSNTLLTTAALYGFSDVFKIILNSAGKDALIDKNTGVVNTLIAAAQFGSLKIIDMIIKSGITISPQDVKSAIFESIDQHNFDVFHKIVETFDFDVESNFLYLLFVATSSESIPIIEYLLERFPDKLDNVVDPNKETDINIDGILSIAAKNQQFESIKLIFNYLNKRRSIIMSKENEVPTNVKPKTINLNLTLSEAAKAGSLPICEFLLKNGITLSLEDIKPTISYLTNKGITSIMKLLFSSFSETMKNKLADKFMQTAIDSQVIDIILLFIQLAKVDGKNLISAVKKGLFIVVDAMLKKNPTPEFMNTNSIGGTALCAAALYNHIDIVKLLIKKPGIDVHAYNNMHETPMLLAARNQNFEIIKLLAPFCTDKKNQWEMSAAFCLFYSSSPNLSGNSFKFSGKIPSPVVSLEPALFFLEFEGIDLMYAYKTQTILGYAIELGYFPLVELLLSRPEYENYLKFNDVFTISSDVMMFYSTQECLFLLNKFIQANNKRQVKKMAEILNENDFRSIFSSACSTGNIDLVKYFLSPESEFKVSEDTILISLFNAISSSNNENMSTINLLMGTDFDINKEIPEQNQTLLVFSSSILSIRIIELIIQHPRFKVNENEVRFSLFATLSSDNMTLFNSLIGLLGYDVNQLNSNGESLLLAAVANSSFAKVSAIITNPSFNPIKSMATRAFFYSMINSTNITPLFIGTNFIDINAPFQEDYSFCHGIVSHVKDNFSESISSIVGWTPLMITAFVCELVTVVIDAPDIDINRKGSDGSAPIFKALMYRQNLLDKLVVNQDLDVNIQDANGNTPLIVTAKTGDFKTSLALLKNNFNVEIDLDIKDNNGMTALDYFEISRVFNKLKRPSNKSDLIDCLSKFVSKERISSKFDPF